MSANLLSVYVSRGKAGGLVVTLRYAYAGKPPSSKKRAEMAKAILGEILERLEESRTADLGFAEDAVKRIRTDKMGA